MDWSILDINCHYLPPAFLREADRLGRRLPHMMLRAAAIPVMADAEARALLLDEFPGYAQIPCLSSPPIEEWASAGEGVALARVANDELAGLCASDPDRYPGFVATLPLLDVDAAISEGQRATAKLGAWGVQVFTNIGGEALDAPRLRPLWAWCAEASVPVWIHPTRQAGFQDYEAEERSAFEVWWALGWPYETTAAMLRLLFGGVLDEFPGLRLVTHHGGGMAPMVEGRLTPGLARVGSRTPEGEGDCVPASASDPARALRERFLADTATFGSVTGLRAALEFFGAERLVFASDMPFSCGGGEASIRTSIESVRALGLPPEQEAAVFEGNARRLLAPRS